MKRLPRLRTLVLAAVGSLLVLALAAALALPWVVDRPRVQALITATAAQSLGRPVTVESIAARVLPLPAVELRGLQVADDPRFGSTPFIMLERGELRFRLRALLTGRIEFGELVLRKPRVTVIQDAGGRWNFATLGSPSDQRPGAARSRPGGAGGAAGAALVGSPVRLENGVVEYVRRGPNAMPGLRLENVDLTMTPARDEVRLDGEGRLAHGDVRLKLMDAMLGLNGTRALTDASLRGRLAIEGKDVSPLLARLVGTEPLIESGVVANLVLEGTVGQPRASGDVTLPGFRVTRTQPACPEPQRRTLAFERVALQAAWEANHFLARPASARLAGGDVTADVTLTLEQGAQLDLTNLVVRGLAIEQVLVNFFCQGYALSGPLDLTGTFAFDPRDPGSTLAGSGRLRLGPGRVVGSQAVQLLAGVGRVSRELSALLGPDAAGLPGILPVEFETITGTFRAAEGVLVSRDLVYVSRGLRIAVAGRYAVAADRLDLDVALDHARGQVHAKVTGRAASPSIRLVPATVLPALDPGAVESGLRDLLRRFR